MSEPKKPQPPQPPKWRGPLVVEPARVPIERYAQVGDVVLWFRGGEESHAPRAAIVLRIDGERADLNLLDFGLKDMIPQDGVYHADSKAVTEGQKEHAGTWRPRPEDSLFRQLAVEGGRATFDGVVFKLKPKDGPKAATPPAA